jgi:hypothetical protein
MTDFEEALREAMHAHDTIAPTTADFRFRAPRSRSPVRRAQWLAATAAAACVLVVAAVALLVSHRGDRSPAPGALTKPPSVTPILSCPAQIPGGATRGYWIPQSPKGIDVASRLLPLETPTHAVICAYLHDNRGRLTGTRPLGGDLATIPADLAWLPPWSDNQPCPSYLATTDDDSYVMALSYPGGVMWLSMPGQHCRGASNGKFVVHNLRAQAEAAYQTGSWKPARPTTMNGCRVTAGRLGQQGHLVPDDPASVQICQQGRHSRTVSGTRADLERLTSVLNRLPTTTWGYEFSCGTGLPTADYILTFGYRVGPSVQVSIHAGCRPAIDNGSLQAEDASGVLALVRQLLGAS